MGFGIEQADDGGRTMRHHLAILLLLGILLYFVGNGSLAITDPVESNYTLTAKEMIASGDYVSPRIYGNYWYDKPVFFYWELIAAFEAFGQTDFAARFFPGLWMIVSMLMTYGFGRRLFGERVGFAAAIILGASVEGWYVGHAVITDTTLVVAISGMLIAFFAGYTRREKHWYYLAFALAGVAVLTKGPIGLCLPGLIILVFLAWERRLKELLSIHILLGFVLFFAVCALWYVPMVQLHGADFLDTFLGVHNVLRATVSEHPEQNVWYFYLLVFLGGCFPWSLAVLPAVVRKIFHRDVYLPQSSEVRFLVVWAVCVFGTFQCFATKYITYTFPYMVPLAILFARYFVGHTQLFRSLAGFMTALLVVAACFVAPPLMRGHSGVEAAAPLAVLSQASEARTGTAPLVVSYRTDYQTSLVYYSGLRVARLETAEVVEKFRPHDGEISWSAKEVMPFEAVEDLPKNRDILLVTGADGEHGGELTEDELARLLSGSWQLVQTAGNRRIFLCKAVTGEVAE
ncbi:MAG: glycosyltransferase family 39 protein [Selenomonas sp.]|uniref:ArnT family glycosyltransferase n=1 Tax=Selenomonas sp. TaxID=2053611 RepID=UPI0025FFAFFF|nr:glycosyltransferase family 39 protein [Selenomonas sp.]MCI6233205.1 glycosyltransferase family 39 protein [Selenomonas sp.]